jgi:MOSC domain-containing protein YiiM
MNNWYSPSEAEAVIDEYCRARRWMPSTFCQRFRLSVPYGGRPGWIARLREGRVQAQDIVHVVETCSLTWPSNAEWPRKVKRPNNDRVRVRLGDDHGRV